MNSTHFLVQFRQLNKLYECMLKEICGRHKLTLIETTIISFLYNNPGRVKSEKVCKLFSVENDIKLPSSWPSF